MEGTHAMGTCESGQMGNQAALSSALHVQRDRLSGATLRLLTRRRFFNERCTACFFESDKHNRALLRVDEARCWSAAALADARG